MKRNIRAEHILNSDGRGFQAYLDSFAKKNIGVNEPMRDLIVNQRSYPAGHEFRLVHVSGEEFAPDFRTTGQIMRHAYEQGYLAAPLESALLLREALTPQNILELGGSCVIVLLEGVYIDQKGPYYVKIGSHGSYNLVYALETSMNGNWYQDNSFVFMLPSVVSD